MIWHIGSGGVYRPDIVVRPPRGSVAALPAPAFPIEILFRRRRVDPQEPFTRLVATLVPASPPFRVETLRLPRAHEPAEVIKLRSRLHPPLIPDPAAAPAFPIEILVRRRRVDSEESFSRLVATLVPAAPPFLVETLRVQRLFEPLEVIKPRPRLHPPLIPDPAAAPAFQVEILFRRRRVDPEEIIKPRLRLDSAIIAQVPFLFAAILRRRERLPEDPVRKLTLLDPGLFAIPPPVPTALLRRPRRLEAIQPTVFKPRLSAALIPDAAAAPDFQVETLRRSRRVDPAEPHKPRPRLKPPLIEDVAAPAPQFPVELFPRYRPARLEEQQEVLIRRVSQEIRRQGTGIVDFGAVFWGGFPPGVLPGRGRGGQRRRWKRRGKKPNIIAKMRAKDRATQEMIDEIKKRLEDYPDGRA